MKRHARKRTILDDIGDAIDNPRSRLNQGIDVFIIFIVVIVVAMIAAEITK